MKSAIVGAVRSASISFHGEVLSPITYRTSSLDVTKCEQTWTKWFYIHNNIIRNSCCSSHCSSWCYLEMISNYCFGESEISILVFEIFPELSSRSLSISSFLTAQMPVIFSGTSRPFRVTDSAYRSRNKLSWIPAFLNWVPGIHIWHTTWSRLSCDQKKYFREP